MCLGKEQPTPIASCKLGGIYIMPTGTASCSVGAANKEVIKAKTSAKIFSPSFSQIRHINRIKLYRKKTMEMI
jgi:hypothetical protein